MCKIDGALFEMLNLEELFMNNGPKVQPGLSPCSQHKTPTILKQQSFRYPNSNGFSNHHLPPEKPKGIFLTFWAFSARPDCCSRHLWQAMNKFVKRASKLPCVPDSGENCDKKDTAYIEASGASQA